MPGTQSGAGGRKQVPRGAGACAGPEPEAPGVVSKTTAFRFKCRALPTLPELSCSGN